MDIAGKSLRRRLGSTVIVFAVFLAFGYVQGSYDWVELVAVPVAFLVGTIAIDAALNRVTR